MLKIFMSERRTILWNPISTLSSPWFLYIVLLLIMHKLYQRLSTSALSSYIRYLVTLEQVEEILPKRHLIAEVTEEKREAGSLEVSRVSLLRETLRVSESNETFDLRSVILSFRTFILRAWFSSIHGEIELSKNGFVLLDVNSLLSWLHV